MKLRSFPIFISMLFFLSALSCTEKPTPVVPAEPTLEVSLLELSTPIGKPVTLSLSLIHSSEVDARFMPITEKLSGLEVVESPSPSSVSLDGGSTRTSREYVIRGFQKGAYTLGPFELRLIPNGTRDEQGEEILESKTITSSTVTLEIASTVSADSPLSALRADTPPVIIEEESQVGRIAFWVIALLGTIVITVLLVIRRKQKLIGGANIPPPPSAHQVALTEFEQVRAENLIEKLKAAEYTDVVSDILRRYIEARFDLPAPERTTEEFLESLARAHVLERQERTFLGEYLTRCDLIKFAAQLPSMRELTELLDTSVEFVNSTALGGAE